MQIELSDEIKDALNSLTLEEINNPVSGYAYKHQLLWYGRNALVHNLVMKDALKVANGEIELNNLLAYFDDGLRSPVNYSGRFTVSLKKIQERGIFIPEHAFWNVDGKKVEKYIVLFSQDINNKINSGFWKDKDYALALTGRNWQANDFKNADLVQRGIKFSIDMWCVIESGFHENKNGFNSAQYCTLDSKDISETTRQQALKVRGLGEKFAEYFSSIISL